MDGLTMRHATRFLLTVTAALSAVLLATTACAGIGGDASGDEDGGKARAGSASPAPSSSPTGPEPTSCPNGGQLIKAVDVPAVHTGPQRIPEATIGGEKVPGFTVPGVDIPARHIPAQCVDIKPAPGGCLSAVGIPGVTVPGVTIPGYTIPGVDAGDVKIDPVRVEPAGADPVTVGPAHVNEVCQLKPSLEGEYVSSAYRGSVYRGSAYRGSAYRGSGYRRGACNSDNECVPAVSIPSVSVPAVSIPAVSVPAASLKAYTAGKSQVFKGGDGSIAYNVEADVLFDFGRSDIKPAAAAELRKIAASIERDIPATAPIQVDGHTDGKGDPASNQRLSEQRARAIVDWLATQGGIDRTRLKATGYGETKPVAANTTPEGTDNPPGRTKNRRVVISAKPS
jgi:outer membrane protein OmpA-like peptidoglycan-associated protein